MYAVRRYRELPTSIYSELAEQTERPSRNMAFQKGSVIAEGEMIRAVDHDAQPSVLRQTLINRLNVGEYLTSLRIRRKVTMVAQEKHEWRVDACLKDTAVQRTVDI